MMNKLIKLVLSFLSILTLALAIALISAQGTTTVSLADFEANPGSTIKAPLMIYNVTDVGGGELNTSFDPSVVHVTDISEGDIGTTMSNINNDSGWAYMNVFGAEGKSGDVVFAYLTLKAVGSEGEKSSLNISVISLFNTNYMDISYKTENGTFAIRDITPPASISNLRNATGNFWINWTWTNPSDNDFNHTMVYLDGTWQTNTSYSYYNATGLNPDTTYEIGTHTVDTSGNVNNTLVNQTAKTLALNSAPVADLNGPYTGMEGVAILFNGSGSYDPDGSIVAYEWDFGDGSTASEVNPTHIYAQKGTYSVSLTVTDNDGATNTSTTTATVADTEPVADFSATPTNGLGPLTVAFTDASTSHDGIEAWSWDFDNDGETDSTEQNPAYEYTEDGIYTVSLIVNESDGDSDTMTKTDYITVTKVNNAPYTPANPSPSDGATDVSIEADLSWTGGDPDAGDIVTYDVCFGTSMSPPLVAENQTGTTYDPGMLNYSTEYYWQIVATDDQGASNESDIWSFTTASSSGSDLVGEWHLDEGTGEIAVDSSGNSNDGVLVNNPTWIKGKIGKALSFDGVNDHINIPNSPSLNPADEITLIAWVKLGVIPQSGWNKIIAKPYTSYTSPWQQYALTLHDNQFVFELNTEGKKDGLIGTGTLDPNTWYHVAGTYDGSAMMIYINAELHGTQSKSGAIAEYPTNVYIGAGIYSDAQVEYINGTIDEVKIYNWALSAGEIMADYEAGLEDTTPPASISNLQNSTGTTWINWTWTNPLDTDFSHTKVYLDGIWQTNTSNMYFNATSLIHNTIYEIGTRTVDTTGNVNSTWVNQTAKTLTVPNNLPVADPNGPYTGMERVPILFNGSGSYDPDGSIVAYEWNFGDGNNATGVTLTHTYAQNGTYTLTLTVTDNEGATDTNTTTATIADTEPVADFTAMPTSGLRPLTVTFTDASTSHDEIVTWEWDFDNDGATESTVQNPTHEYTEDGVYTVCLKVSESDGDSDTTTKADYITVTKVNNAPFKPENPSPSDGAADVSEDADLSWTGGDPDAGDIVTYDVYFGTSTSPPLVAESQPETTYDPGTLDHSTEYHWRIVATDNNGASNESDIWGFTTAASPGSDLAGEWHLDEGTGEIAMDSSGNSNDGTLVNNLTWVKGKIEKALSFDGETDYISIPNSPSLNPADEITIIAWVKPGVMPQSGWNKIIAKPYTSYTSPWQQYALTLHDNQFVFELNTEGTKEGITGTGTLDHNTWYHVAGTYDGSEMRIYINAELHGMQPKSGAIAQYPTNVHIGAGIYRDAQVEYINGTIDEVKIYNWALGAEEIRADYEAGSSNHPPTAIIDSITPDPAEQGKDTVSFTGHGTDTDGSVVTYHWSSSIDGLLSTASSFSKPASELSAGMHTIYFKVQDDEGAWSTEITEDLTIIEPANQAPVADPSGSYTGTEGVPIAYDGSDSYDTDGSIVAYEWAFGDGSTSSEVNPTHTYAQDGIYTVTLTVTDNDGATNTSATTATIADTEPVADFSAMPTSGQEPLTVTFTDDSESYDGIVTWDWDFDNDGVTDSTEQNPTHVYAEEGVYTVSLTVRESDGDSDTMTKADYITVTKVNNPPVSDPSGPYTGTEGVAIAFDGSTSMDPDGSIVSYEWEFGDGTTATGATPTYTYAQNGTYNVTLTVTDNDGATNTSTTTATIADTGPTAAFSATPTSGLRPLTVAFTDASTSHDGIEAWSWDFDSDGETDSTVQNPTHVYAEEGVYIVCLTVTESDGDSDTMTKADYITVTKANNPPFKPDNPSPSDGAADVSEDADLSWTGGDPDAEDTVTYDVYFGTSISPPLVVENQSGTSYDPGTLDHSTGYYWRIVATDDHDAMTEGGVWTFTTAAAPDTPPIVSNPSATPDTILNDNGRPRIPGTNISQLSVTVTDDTKIDTVTIDLSPIGGSYESQMTNIPGTDTWTITTNAVEGINIDHNLIVTATDTNGNSDSSVSIQLTILRRGDVDHDNDVDRADALAIRRYIKGHAPDPGVFIGDVYPATGDNVVDEMDASYIFEYVSGDADEP